MSLTEVFRILVDVDSDDADKAMDDLLSRFAGPAGLATAAGVAGAAILALTADTLNAADGIDQLASRSGLSAEELQILTNIAATAGGEMDDVADAAREMQLRLAEAAALGSGPAVDALRLVNLTLEDFAGLDVDEQFALLRDRISEVVDPAERLFVAEELLGGSTERLNALLSASSTEYVQLRTRIGEVGTFTNEQIADLNEAHDAWELLKQAVSGTATTLVAEAAPAITAVAENLLHANDALARGLDIGGLFEQAWRNITGAQIEYNEIADDSLTLLTQQEAAQAAAKEQLDEAYEGMVRVGDQLVHESELRDVNARLLNEGIEALDGQSAALDRNTAAHSSNAAAISRVIEAQVRLARSRGRQLGGAFPGTTEQRGTFDPIPGLTGAAVGEDSVSESDLPPEVL